MLILSYYWDKKKDPSPAAGDSLKCIVHNYIRSVGVMQLSLRARKFFSYQNMFTIKGAPKTLIPLSLRLPGTF